VLESKDSSVRDAPKSKGSSVIVAPELKDWSAV